MGKNNNKPNDFKNKPGVKYPDDDSKPSTSGYNNRYQDKNSRDPKRTETKKRSHSPEDGNRDCHLVDGKKVKVQNRLNVENENNFPSDDQFLYQQQTLPLPQHQNMQQMPHMNLYSNYAYNAPEHYNVESNQGNYPMVASYNVYGAMNNQWPCNQVDPMCMPPSNMQLNAAPFPVSTGMDMASNVDRFNPYMPMANDMYTMGMNNFAPYQLYAPDNVPVPPVKEKITLPNCTLSPPRPGTLIRRRERHPGCKTVFVGRLPENITEELLREIFGHCGEIANVRMSNKNFCHIRFASMETVDRAMMLSEYRLIIGEQDDNSSSGRIHVDFARARDDAHEWQCLQRAKEREIRHRERLEQEATRPPTPPPVVHYSEHEANLLSDRLKNEETLKEAIHVLVTWLDRGECNRKSCGNFYSMIQCANSHVKRLLNEKNKLDEELNKAKLLLQEKMSVISLQFYEIKKFCDVLILPNIWDTFNKTQKKNIDSMRKTTLDIVGAHSAEVVAERVEDEMELSDDDCVAEDPVDSLEYQDSRKKEEVEKIKAEIADGRNHLQSVLEEIMATMREKEKNNSIHNTLLKEREQGLLSKKVEQNRLRKEKEEYLTSHSMNKIAQNSQVSENDWDRKQSNNSLNINQDDILLITLITSFLNVHPFGASVQYICSYLQKHDPKINDRYIENLLQQYPNLFEEKISGIGVALTKNWFLVAFNTRIG